MQLALCRRHLLVSHNEDDYPRPAFAGAALPRGARCVTAVTSFWGLKCTELIHPKYHLYDTLDLIATVRSPQILAHQTVLFYFIHLMFSKLQKQHVTGNKLSNMKATKAISLFSNFLFYIQTYTHAHIYHSHTHIDMQTRLRTHTLHFDFIFKSK